MDLSNPKLAERMKHFSTRVEALAGVVEKFVENNLIERDQLDQQIKSVLQNAGNFVRENWGGQSAARVSLKVKKWEHFKGELPQYQTAWASGFDVRAQLTQPLSLSPGQRALVPTGLSFEIPMGFELQVRPRSGWAIREGVGMVNAPGTIDADYRGEVKVILINWGQETVTIQDQDRIAQMVLCPVLQAEFELTETLSETSRGEGGFGSTGQGESAKD